jgi:hypothetical protein
MTDPYVMVHQLSSRAQRVQLEEYTEEIEKSKRDNDGPGGTGSSLSLRTSGASSSWSSIDSYIAISTPPAK